MATGCALAAAALCLADGHHPRGRRGKGGRRGGREEGDGGGGVGGAGVVAAIVEGGGDATLAGGSCLASRPGTPSGRCWYLSTWSPQLRETIDLADLVVAAERGEPGPVPGCAGAGGRTGNVRRGQRIANLQDAARNELRAALVVLIAWLVLGPGVGLLERDESPRNRERRPADRTTDHNADDAITDDNAHVYHAFASDDYEAAGTAHDSERRTLTAASRNARPVASP